MKTLFTINNLYRGKKLVERPPPICQKIIGVVELTFCSTRFFLLTNGLFFEFPQGLKTLLTIKSLLAQ